MTTYPEAGTLTVSLMGGLSKLKSVGCPFAQRCLLQASFSHITSGFCFSILPVSELVMGKPIFSTWEKKNVICQKYHHDDVQVEIYVLYSSLLFSSLLFSSLLFSSLLFSSLLFSSLLFSSLLFSPLLSFSLFLFSLTNFVAIQNF